MGITNEKGRAIALLPIGIFLLIFLGSGILTGDFYAMPAIVAFLIALLVAFLQNRKLPFGEKLQVISKGLADENIITNYAFGYFCEIGISFVIFNALLKNKITEYASEEKLPLKNELCGKKKL